jgi:hypothetical protein
LKLLVEFLIQTKAIFIKEFLKNVEDENKIKIDDLIEALKQSKRKNKKQRRKTNK